MKPYNFPLARQTWTNFFATVITVFTSFLYEKFKAASLMQMIKING